MTAHPRTHPLTAILVPALALALTSAWAGTAQPPADGPRPSPGVTRLGPMGGPGPGMMPPRAPAEAEHPELDRKARQPWRPAWAPLPALRGEVVATPFLHELLSSPDADSRARSAFLLGQIGSPDCAPLLAKRLGDPVRAVRIQAGIALACLRDPRGLPVCAAALKTADPWVRYYAAFGLWRLDSSEARGALRNAKANQGILVAQAITGALKTRFAAPPKVAPLPRTAKVWPKPSPGQIWEQAADVFIQESDWWWHKGDYEQAIRCHEVGILLDPTYVEAYSVTAWLQWSLGRNRDALATLHRGIKANPKSADAYYNLGFHHFNLKQYALAEGFLRKSAELSGDALSRRTYAHCLEKLGRLQESLAQWSAILRVEPGDLVAKRNYDRVKALIEGQ